MATFKGDIFLKITGKIGSVGWKLEYGGLDSIVD